MGMIASDLAQEIAVSDYYVGGYSLGGTHAAFVSLLDSKEKRFNFKKAVVINPAVNLYNSVNRLDKMVADNMAEDREGVTQFIDQLFDQVVSLYNSSDQVDFADPAFIYRAYAVLEPPERELELLIGLAFRLTSNDMAFTSDVMTNSAYVVPKNAQLTATTSLTDVMLEGLRLNFVNFFDGLYVPYVQRREPGVTRAELIAARQPATRSKAICAGIPAWSCWAPRTMSSSRATMCCGWRTCSASGRGSFRPAGIAAAWTSASSSVRCSG